MKALFFGSFNPPHLGHFNVVNEVLKTGLSVDIIPSYHNPFKQNQISFDLRYEMTKLCFSGLNNVFVSGIEKQIYESEKNHSESDYVPTYEVLKTYSDQNIFIITTQETYSEISTWYKGSEILKKYKFLILGTNHLGTEKSFYDLIKDQRFSGNIFKMIPDINICSSEIRENIYFGNDVSMFIPESVNKFIISNNLYI